MTLEQACLRYHEVVPAMQTAFAAIPNVTGVEIERYGIDHDTHLFITSYVKQDKYTAEIDKAIDKTQDKLSNQFPDVLFFTYKLLSRKNTWLENK